MCIAPCAAKSSIHQEGDGQIRGALHGAFDLCSDVIRLVLGDFQQQFIVDL